MRLARCCQTEFDEEIIASGLEILLHVPAMAGSFPPLPPPRDQQQIWATRLQSFAVSLSTLRPPHKLLQDRSKCWPVLFPKHSTTKYTRLIWGDFVVENISQFEKQGCYVTLSCSLRRSLGARLFRSQFSRTHSASRTTVNGSLSDGLGPTPRCACVMPSMCASREGSEIGCGGHPKLGVQRLNGPWKAKPWGGGPGLNPPGHASGVGAAHQDKLTKRQKTNTTKEKHLPVQVIFSSVLKVQRRSIHGVFLQSITEIYRTHLLQSVSERTTSG